MYFTRSNIQVSGRIKCRRYLLGLNAGLRYDQMPVSGRIKYRYLAGLNSGIWQDQMAVSARNKYRYLAGSSADM